MALNTVVPRANVLSRVKPDSINLAISLLTVSTVTLFFAISSSNFLQWFLIPVSLCGVVIGIDAVAWLRKQIDFVDPVGVIGVYGFHFFYLAPMLHIYYNFWIPDVLPPENWANWLGGMALLNLFGLLLYRYFRIIGFNRASVTKYVWTIDNRKFVFSMTFFIIVTFATQIFVYQQYGGILGYINAFEDGGTQFDGKGFIFSISESFPILTLILAVFLMKLKNREASWLSIMLILALYFLEVLIFGGLRGSRSNTVWGVFWGLGIIHLYLKPINRRFMFVIGSLLVFFMYVYGFYKSAGLEGLSAITNSESRVAQEAKSGRDTKALLLWDFGRSDVQAYLLYRLLTNDSNYNLAYGRTYLSSAALLIPKNLIPERPPTKVKYGTEIQYGMGSYEPTVFQSARVYGLAGEGMLNFGFLAPPFLFALFGFFVGRARGWLYSWMSDSRVFMVPFLSVICFNTISSDSDNIVFLIFKQGFIPSIAILLGSTIIKSHKKGAGR